MWPKFESINVSILISGLDENVFELFVKDEFWFVDFVIQFAKDFQKLDDFWILIKPTASEIDNILLLDSEWRVIHEAKTSY